MPPMLRSSAFMRPMTRLAWLAALLMVLMPSVSRVLAAQAAPAGWAQVCSADVALAAEPGADHDAGHGTTDPDPDAAPHAHGSADCGYCLLGAPLPAAHALAPAPHARPATRVVWADPPLRAHAVRLCGLGAQAPPAPL
jgi:hypothetical protein